MTLKIPSEFEDSIRRAASAAGFDDVNQYVLSRLLGAEVAGATREPRKGGQWSGRVVIADDFDELPGDLKDAFGMTNASGTAS